MIQDGKDSPLLPSPHSIINHACVNYRGKHAVILLLLHVITARRFEPCLSNHMGWRAMSYGYHLLVFDKDKQADSR